MGPGWFVKRKTWRMKKLNFGDKIFCCFFFFMCLLLVSPVTLKVKQKMIKCEQEGDFSINLSVSKGCAVTLSVTNGFPCFGNSKQAQTEDWLDPQCSTLSLPSALSLSLSISETCPIYESSFCSVLPPLIPWFLNAAHTTSRDWDRIQWQKLDPLLLISYCSQCDWYFCF